ncbi:unnamed protein product [Cuscuta epithymum]|uniref:Uncharacterized protein n=1 Tax=Cuscuta epithymum TaxID=186058 RepID=A0AAV0EMB7_9ASTE|nr:unnamed protein product [Cuscuta epithymum]
MGNSCSSSSSSSSSLVITRSTKRKSDKPAVAGVAILVKLDGKAQEFWQPAVRAGDILSENPNCILCSSEALNVDSPVEPLAGDEELQLGQLYFLLPIGKSHLPLSLHDLCVLAVTASAALGDRRLNVVRESRVPAGGGGFSAEALVAAGDAASFGWFIKMVVASKKLTSVLFEPKSSYCIELLN